MAAARPPDAVLETERCWIRNWRVEDVDRVFDLYSRWEVSRWLGRTPQAMQTPDAARRTVERWSQLNLGEPLARRWAVERKADAVVAGTVLLVPLPDGDGEFEVGWHLHPDSWGSGYATESARAVVRWGFAGGLDEVVAVVRPDNAASLAVCRRLGMTPLGRTTRYYDTELELFRVQR